jgi:hypothetical protein
MLGQLCPLGTGAFDLLLNEDDLEEATDLLALEKCAARRGGGGGREPGKGGMEVLGGSWPQGRTAICRRSPAGSCVRLLLQL